MAPSSSHTLLVAGAVSYDHLVYPMSFTNGSARDNNLYDQDEDASQLVIRSGAADLVAQLLTAATPQWGFEVLGPILQSPGSDCLKTNATSVVDLEHASTSESSLRVVRRRRIGKMPVWHQPFIDPTNAAKASTVIITGSGEALYDAEPALDFLQKLEPRYIIHHMTRPLASGRLWDIIRHGPLTRDGVPDPDCLAVIVDAEDIRAEGIPLSRSLSWEQTTEDFVRNLGSNGRLDTLVTCPNLIVRFGNEGVIHHRGRDATDPRLYFHPRQVEKDWRAEIHMIELSSAFTAGFALGFADSAPPTGESAIRLGIAAARDMALNGFVTNPSDGAPDYPIMQIIDSLAAEKSFSAVSIPSARISRGDAWNIFDAVTGDPAEVARQIVTQGPERTLAKCPLQQFGKLMSVDRTEQESLRAVVDAVQERLAFETSQPTSIGILGPPGSGKKFVATNLAQHFAQDAQVRHLTFNGRLLRLEDLIALCHTIRDNTASGLLTVVCFENFEAILEPKNELLNDFLVMMRDGNFTDRGHVRNLGHPLLFFLVNQHPERATNFTSDTRTPTASEHEPSRSADESQLLDSVHGVVRILGPNQTGPCDKMFPIRRAMMLRQMLKQKFPHLDVSGTIKIDDAVLHALLLVPSFKHGLRSLDKILSTSRLSNKTKFDVSSLPPEEQIQLHVDGRIFMSYLRSPKLPAALREKLAQGLFVAYKTKRVEMARTPAEKEELESDPSMYDWDELAPELKESTRSQADDIPRKLRAVNCFMLDQDRGEPLVHVPEFTTAELDMLSEMEHERFNAERLQRQWRMGPRSSNKRTTPFLVPWRDLTQDWKVSRGVH